MQIGAQVAGSGHGATIPSTMRTSRLVLSGVIGLVSAYGLYHRSHGIIAWIVLGALAGFIANLIMGGGEGLVMMVVLGIVGAVVGGFIAGTLLGIADITGFNLSSLLVAVFGAIVVIFVARMFTSRGASRAV